MRQAKVSLRLVPGYLVLGYLLVWALSFASPLYAQSIGKVVFAAGDTKLSRGSLNMAVSAGLGVEEGDHLVTGADGYVQLRMNDGGFISVRPASAFLIETYQYDPEVIERNRVKLHLEQGVVRSRTGRAGHLNKPGFELSTPVAVIGIRGTDFTVYTTERLSRLSVSSGGVVMSPLDGSRCGVEDACLQGSRELQAGDVKRMLEVVSGDTEVRMLEDGVAPDEIAPPHPSEELLLDEDTARATFYNDERTRGESAAPAQSYEEGLERVERYLSKPGLLTDVWARGESVGDAVLPAETGRVSDPRIIWGRWSQYNEYDIKQGTHQVAILRHNGFDYAALNSVFALLETDPGPRNLPNSGRVYFDLDRYEAYVKRGTSLEKAGLSNAALVVDFDSSRFATRLDLHADSLPGVVPILGQGNINQGYMSSDSLSPALINGVLAPGAGEAGLLFEYQISPGVDAVGATHWVKGD